MYLSEWRKMQKKNFSRGRGGSRRRGRKISKENIAVKKFINLNPTPIEEKPAFDENFLFEDFALKSQILTNLAENNFKNPSEIQKQTIPLALEKRDIIGLSNTGTGKTIAFLLPILNGLMRKNSPQKDGVLDLRKDSIEKENREHKSALILAPTRELAQQIEEEFRKFSPKTGVRSALLVGGMRIGGQFRDLRRRPQMIIGTPGRVKDHIDRGSLNLSKVKFFVLDEADRMLDMGFVNDIIKIAELLPKERQTFCFSATFDKRVEKITSDFMKDPEIVKMSVNQSAEHIHQDVVEFENKDEKHEKLLEILRREEVRKTVIFGDTKHGVQKLSDKLGEYGFSTRAIHGDKDQRERRRAINAFKSHAAEILVATDVAARGLDISGVSHVINFDTPQSYEDYIHRIGRTGRGGKSGSAITFVAKNLDEFEPKIANNPRRSRGGNFAREGKNSGKNFRSNYNKNGVKHSQRKSQSRKKSPSAAAEARLVELANS